MTDIIPIENLILLVRGKKVMLDADLARLYGVPTKVLNQSVRRNSERFPEDFMFQLNDQETESLRSQIVTSKERRGGTRYNSYVFTEYGVAMLSSVLRSSTAIQVNIEIMRAFGKLRAFLQSTKELSDRLAHLEKKYDHQFKVVFDAIRQLMMPPPGKTKKIGFL